MLTRLRVFSTVPVNYVLLGHELSQVIPKVADHAEWQISGRTLTQHHDLPDAAQDAGVSGQVSEQISAAISRGMALGQLVEAIGESDQMLTSIKMHTNNLNGFPFLEEIRSDIYSEAARQASLSAMSQVEKVKNQIEAILFWRVGFPLKQYLSIDIWANMKKSV